MKSSTTDTPICTINGMSRDQEDFYRLKPWIEEELAKLAERRLKDLRFASTTTWNEENQYMEYEVKAYECRQNSEGLKS